MTLLAEPLLLPAGCLRKEQVDVEKLARKALEDDIHWRGAVLSEHLYESALSYLIAVGWEESRRYDANRGWSFSKFAYSRMRKRLVNWYRSELVNYRRVGFSEETTRTESLDADDHTQVAALTNVGPEILETINIALLSPISRSTIELVVKPGLEQGKTMLEVARERSIPRRDLTERMKRLRKEIEEKCLAA
jgi:hypothetical protein